MSILDALDTIFDAGTRRRKKLADLVAARVALQQAWDDAIANGADIDKPQAALAKHDVAIAAAQAVVDATEAAAQRQKQAAQDDDKLAAERAAVDTFEELVDATSDFEELVAEIAPRWARVEAAHQAAVEGERIAQKLGSSIRTVTRQKVTASDLWTRIWTIFVRAFHKSGATLRPFPSGVAINEHESATSLLRRQLAHHRNSIKEPTQ